MVGIYGISGIPEPANTTSEPTREKRNQVQAEVLSSTEQDHIVLSAEAQQASAAARFVEAAKAKSEEIRAERIAEARKQLEEGTYKLQEVVLAVAARVSRFLVES
jgi:anti-sigma28 factor (negative regulator of flagellin synthesis)